jgi:ATP-binding protein involved in chromosome partitioning
MSFFTGDDGKKYKIFGEGGVKKTADEFKKEFLGEIPIDPKVGKQETKACLLWSLILLMKSLKYT